MKFKEVTPPVERKFVMELNEDELKLLIYVMGYYGNAAASSAACAAAGVVAAGAAAAQRFIDHVGGYPDVLGFESNRCFVDNDE